MFLCLAGSLFLSFCQPPAKKTLGGVELVELPAKVTGYRTLQVAGFTVLADPQVIDPPEKLDRTPLEVLEGELKTISRIVHAKALAELRKLTIWAEWDEEQPLTNGRKGKALAVYYGGSQRGLLAAGKNPLKANNITILSTRDLTREHQPKRESGRCVLLHEMVHAIHHTILGFNHAQIQAAYQQALERGKVERGSYAATNAQEFFAEMSCAYLDKLPYFPRDREELKKHDPPTFQLLAVIWSGAESAGNRNRASDKQEVTDLPVLPMTLEDFEAGEIASGPPSPPAEALRGKVVMILFFAAQSPDALQALSKASLLEKDLAEMGLVVLASHASRGAEKAAVRRAAQQRAPNLSVTMIPKIARDPGLGKLPHALVFDPEGALRFSGSPYDAEAAVRQLIGQTLLAKVSTENKNSTLLTPTMEALRKGEKPAVVLGKLEKLTPVEKPAQEARENLVRVITEGPKDVLKTLQALKDNDPARAYCDWEAMTQRWKGTSIAVAASQSMATIRNNPQVQKELRARLLLERARNLDTQLSRRPGAFEPSSLAFRTTNADLLGALNQVVEKMRLDYQGTPTLAETERLVSKYQPR